MIGRVVGYCVVKNETKTTLTDVFQDFISPNDINVEPVVVDKDVAEIAAIKEAFPERWHKTTPLLTFTQKVSEGYSAAILTSVSEKRSQILNEVEKREKLFDNLINVMISCGQKSFDKRCQVIHCLMELWNDGIDVRARIAFENEDDDLN
ncbi:hypothetical protein PoB_007088100 [Plakobranchus ocellatus]|uniref:ZSWIM1/3 RNaseH-like domain-containing protein n=1 Tax=Plakobranchus ocellatus TaxID=259542 RepID=A0AAV4DJL7_9GAST|nr:hypothetical protein PoB_007088100 [Plakobranchus ocellatus]